MRYPRLGLREWTEAQVHRPGREVRGAVGVHLEIGVAHGLDERVELGVRRVGFELGVHGAFGVVDELGRS